jgi:hypothetical protein
MFDGAAAPMDMKEATDLSQSILKPRDTPFVGCSWKKLWGGKLERTQMKDFPRIATINVPRKKSQCWNVMWIATRRWSNSYLSFARNPRRELQVFGSNLMNVQPLIMSSAKKK